MFQTIVSSRAVTACTLVLLLLAAGCGGASEQRAMPMTITAEGRKASDFHFFPVTYREANRVALPVTFTDGTRAELVYLPKLDIAGLGGGPYGSGTLKGESPTRGRSDVVGRDFWIFYGEVEDVVLSLNGGKMPRLLGEYQGVGQTVGLWDFRSDHNADYLAFQFGRWVVLMYDYASDGDFPGAAMTDAERASWSASFWAARRSTASCASKARSRFD